MSFLTFLEESAETKDLDSNTDKTNQDKIDEAAKKAKKSYTIKITGLDNDAFVEDFNGEIEFVLKQAIKNIQRDTLDKPLRDTNGNDVGSVK